MLEPLVFTAEQKATYKAIFAPNATADQFGYFIDECQRRALTPGTHVVFQLRNSQEYSQSLQRSVSVQKVTLITTINALRLIAQRTGKFRGYGRFTWYYTDQNNNFQPSITSPIPLGRIPHAASVELFREGWQQPVFSVARFDAYVQTKRSNDKEVPTRMWELRGEEQLAKCAEAAGLRMVAPEECGGLYIAEEFERDIKEETPLEKLKDLAGHCVPSTQVVVPQPTVAPAINQEAAPVEIVSTITPPVTLHIPMPSGAAAPLPPHSPVARPVAPPQAPPRPAGPPAPPKQAGPPVAAPLPPMPNPNRQPAREMDDRESPAEIAVVADAVARDKDPKTGPFANTTRPDPAHETRAFENPLPAAVPAASPAQPVVSPKPQIPAAQPAAAVPTGEAPATQVEYSAFVNGRAAKVVRDKLKDVKNAGPMMKDYLLRESGKTKLQAISAADFERMISALETATIEEATKLLKGGK